MEDVSDTIIFPSYSLRVRLIRELGGEGRNFNGEEGRGDNLIKSVFGSQGDVRDFKIILLF